MARYVFSVLRNNSFIIIVTLGFTLSSPLWYNGLQFSRAQTLTVTGLLAAVLGIINGKTGFLDFGEECAHVKGFPWFYQLILILIAAYAGSFVLKFLGIEFAV